jgi:hypothetical protein
MESQQENYRHGTEQFVPNRNVSNNRWRPTHGHHQYAGHDMNGDHKSLVFVHGLTN